MEAIKLTNINKSFGEGENKFQVLNNINFTANKGEFNIITGPSGSGKSTLLTIMGALRNPDSGTVQLEQIYIDKLNSREKDKFRLNNIGFILQAHDLVPFLTVQQQFTLVDKVRHQGNLNSEELINLLKKLGIDNLIKHFPSELSGGQSQRVTIARGLYTNPNLVFADEPTASLDSKRVTEVCELLYTLAKKDNKTIVVVTHDDRVNQYADHIYNLVDGQMSLLK